MALALGASLLLADLTPAAAQALGESRLQAQTDDYRRTVGEGALLGAAAGRPLAG